MSHHSHYRPNRQQLFVVAILVLALYVVVPQLGDFQSSWSLLRSPEWGWALAAVGCIAATYLAAAATYCLLAFKPLRYGQALLVQLAAMFVNRLLPGGVGAVGTNFIYLRKQRHTIAQAGSVVTVNNLLGFTGHGVLLAITVSFFADNIDQVATDVTPSGLVLTVSLIAVVIAIGLLLLIFGRKKFLGGLRDIIKQLFSYRKRPLRLGGALTSSMVLTLANVACLACCAFALDVQLSFATLLLIFSVGVGVGTATPTPGGLGGFEAGLVAGFVAYGVDGSAALAVALLFRLISYWLSLAAGGFAFVVCQRRQLLTL